jgi:hypothetical protein
VAIDPFAPLRARLNGALSISEIGQRTLDGQQVTGFTATLPPLVSTVKLAKPRRGHRTLTVTSKQRLDIYIAADGLPVRSRSIVTTAGMREISVVNVPSINEPVAISAPPASQTITASELKALERRAKAKHEAEERARARARAKSRAGKG